MLQNIPHLELRTKLLRKRGVLALCLAWLLMGVACASQITREPDILPNYLVIGVVGELRYKLPGWNDYQPVSLGTFLPSDTVIQSAENGELDVLCLDLSVVHISANYHGGISCSKSATILIRNSSPVVTPRREIIVVADIPYVTSPRHTFIRTPYPKISWAPTGDADTVYTVRLLNQNSNWHFDTTQLEMQYPEDAPQLQPLVPYKIEITDSGSLSSTEEKTAMDLGFVLLPAEKISELDQQLEQVEQMNLDSFATSLIESVILASYEVRNDAIFALNELIQKNSRTPAIMLQLGNLYMEVGLYQEAIHVYNDAYLAYQDIHDKAGQAAAQFGMGAAYSNQGKVVDAKEHLNLALTLFEELNHHQGSAEAEALLRQINSVP